MPPPRQTNTTAITQPKKIAKATSSRKIENTVKQNAPVKPDTNPPINRVEKMQAQAQEQFNQIMKIHDEHIQTADKIRRPLYEFRSKEKYKLLPEKYPKWTQCVNEKFTFGKSTLSRQWLAAKLEVYLGVEIGTYPEWSIRPIARAKFPDKTKTTVFAEAKKMEMAKTRKKQLPSEETMTEAIKMVFEKVATAKAQKKMASENAEEAKKIEEYKYHLKIFAEMGLNSPHKTKGKVAWLLAKEFPVKDKQNLIIALQKKVDQENSVADDGKSK